uniref:Uncharacterized protein n=2 Tax=Hemiselmis andersenii TaxID=464988 RepID=A0A6U2DSR5_HEMAN|mmetsp:Transcript_2577/g.5734  ORF Transcript_2577/g.5734 Transcript_2577/m.5734 type:complete len:537 (+) Transcript_2577:254-1864(+)
MTSPEAVRVRLEGYARGKIASILQPLSERLLVEQPVDPVAFMVQYLTAERSDLRSAVADETIAVADEVGTEALPTEDHPLLDRIWDLKHRNEVLSRLRRKDAKRLEAQNEELQGRIEFLESKLNSAGIEYDTREPVPPEMMTFLDWEAGQLDASPEDDKDDEGFQYRSYTEMPPFTKLHGSMVASLLKEEDFNKHVKVSTGTGFTLSNMIQSGVTGPNVPVGICMGDEDCLAMFGGIIAPIAQALHGKDLNKSHHVTDVSVESVPLPDEETVGHLSDRIFAITLKAHRSISGFPLAAGISTAQRSEIASLMRDTARPLVKSLGGEFAELSELDPNVEEVIEALGMCMEATVKEGSVMHLSGAGRGWPADRALWYDKSLTSVVHVNGMDHLSIMVHNADGDVVGVWADFVRVYGLVESSLESHRRRFSAHHAFGFLTSDPGMMGCAFTASCLLRVPIDILADQVKSCSQKFGMRAVRVPDDKQEGGGIVIWELSSKGTADITEAAIMQNLTQAAAEIVQLLPQDPQEEEDDGGGGEE